MTDILFITGRLAAPSLEKVLAKMAPEFSYKIKTLGISVAALMNTAFISRHLSTSEGCDKVVIPGSCKGDPEVISQKLGVDVVKGPCDLRDLPVFFGGERDMEGYGEYHVKIVAEMVDAFQMSLPEILAQANYYRNSGADLVDIGCPAQGSFDRVGEVVDMLKAEGFIVSLDTFDHKTIRQGLKHGIDLLLSVNSRNIDLAPELNCKTVVIPDFGQGLESLEKNAEILKNQGVDYILDPILDPLSFGFTKALVRFHKTRKRHPDTPILMGLGNLTELTEADSTGINTLMAGVMTELEVDYLLTTEVVQWARGSVRELDLARRQMFFAHKQRVLPKGLDSSLVCLKDRPFEILDEAALRQMQSQVKDRNYRIFTDFNQVYVFNRDLFLTGTDPADLFARLEVSSAGHAFYLGRELERACLAVRLGKKYLQEKPLDWGYLDFKE
ncbi:DUF6513 domain-containing protein [Dethiosulfatarculus sandiegensis]|uniref:PTS mannitol transporter subunit IIABC n=1 Tax=Dethiosulfatarculus sandiegensis TaxID=1429043 RepID=A0A0D2J8S9_9BACT|nr:DUF6513 domain-containing protein [Dethiosulfatarculus sandiegensis]KIX12131.1 PTS mannitol transporter subunit IIABC [Dethiosulfatarculus sandiegensis]